MTGHRAMCERQQTLVEEGGDWTTRNPAENHHLG